jgi:hypothetical protein
MPIWVFQTLFPDHYDPDDLLVYFPSIWAFTCFYLVLLQQSHSVVIKSEVPVPGNINQLIETGLTSHFM